MRAIITGTATGIGAATVQKLKAAGFEVVGLDISQPDNVDQWIQIDLSDPVAIGHALDQLDGEFDCLINNAGLPPREGLSKTILAVNYLGLVQLTNSVEDRLKDGAAIVNTASRAGAGWRENMDQVKALLSLYGHGDLEGFIAENGIDHIRAYNLSKEAVIVWGIANTERLLAKNLRVNSVSPAAVSTGILGDFATAFGEKMARNVERVGRPGTPEEVAEVIMFLISPASSWLKGNNIIIDGGMSALALADHFEFSRGVAFTTPRSKA